MKKLTAVLISSLAASAMLASEPAETAASLAARVVPSIADRIVFRTIDSPADTFAISGLDGKVLIEGNNPTSMAVGLNNYLRRSLGTNVSWYASEPLQVPDEIVIP